MLTRQWLPVIFFVALGCSGSVLAGTDSDELQALAKQVAALNDEVAQLKKSIELLQAIQPDITSIMPDFAERFHVMHYAGEAEDWAVASHELLGMQRLVGIMTRVDPEKAAMVNGFLLENFKDLDAAIEHENQKAFRQTLAKTVDNCNGCHVAVGSPSMKITLNVHDSLSMRHSHDLKKSEKPGDHTHLHN